MGAHGLNKLNMGLLYAQKLAKIYTHGKKLGNTSYVTRVNFGQHFFYNLNMY